jgi:hypothetical protein
MIKSRKTEPRERKICDPKQASLQIKLKLSKLRYSRPAGNHGKAGIREDLWGRRPSIGFAVE